MSRGAGPPGRRYAGVQSRTGRGYLIILFV